MDALGSLRYVDDSGYHGSGLVVFGWLAFAPANWRVVMERWFAVRRRAQRRFGVDIDAELHATHFVNGRGRVSSKPPERYTRSGVVQWKTLGRDLARMLLDELTSIEGVAIGAVYRRLAPNPTTVMKADVYRALVDAWELELAERREHAMVFLDGDGSEREFRTAHTGRALEHRWIIEDPIMTDSARSHFIQMADLIAWSAFAAVERHPGHEFAWGWYEAYLARRDPRRRPVPI